MQCKKTVNLGLSILLGYCITFTLNTNVFTQTTSAEKPEIKDFGKSLNKFDGKDNSQDNKKQIGEVTDDETIRVKTELVVSNILVTNQNGNAILGLKQSDFVIIEDGKPQEIAVFSFGENANIPRSIVLIIDYSESQIPFIKNSIEAAKHLVDKLSPSDRMAIVTDDVELLVNFTKDKTLLKKELDSLSKRVKSKKSGSSQQYTALIATLNEMFNEKDIRPIVIFQTDGDELFAFTAPKTDEKLPLSHTSRAPEILLNNYSLEDVYSLIRKSRATIFSIIPGFRFIGFSREQQLEKMQIMDNKYREIAASWGYIRGKLQNEELILRSNRFLEQQLALFEVSKLSGGYTDYIERPKDAENVYSTIFTVINNQYVIGYYPTNQEQDGKQRKINIEVKGHPEYTIVGRKTYFAPGQ